MTDSETKHHLSMATRLLELHKTSSPSGMFVALGCRVEVITDPNDSLVSVATCEEPKYAEMLSAYANTAPQLAKEVVRLNGVIDSLTGGDSKRLTEISKLKARVNELEYRIE